MLEFLLQKLPWILLGAWTIYSLLNCIVYNGLKEQKLTNFYVFESIPQVFITLGLLGTFMGITYGLINFNTTPELIKDSIGDLLDGLKVAFFTSIYGIVCNLIFGKIIKFKIQKGHAIEPEFASELHELKKMNYQLSNLSKTLANSIDDAIVKSLQGVIEDFNNTFKSFIDDLIERNFDKLTDTINQLIRWQQEYRIEIIQLKESYQDLVQNHESFVSTTKGWVETLDEVAGQTSHLASVINEFKSLTNDDSRFSKIIYELRGTSENLAIASRELTDHTSGLSEVKDAFLESKEEISQWLEREDGVRDSANALSHSLEELRKFEIASIENLDERFRKDLESTFKSLDSLMKEYILYLETMRHEK